MYVSVWRQLGELRFDVGLQSEILRGLLVLVVAFINSAFPLSFACQPICAPSVRVSRAPDVVGIRGSEGQWKVLERKEKWSLTSRQCGVGRFARYSGLRQNRISFCFYEGEGMAPDNNDGSGLDNVDGLWARSSA